MDPGVHVADEPDKYGIDGETVHIDCEQRLHLCRAACCRLRFVLSEQDVREAVIQWEPGAPYINRQRTDGYCVHCDTSKKGCQVYERRPAVCRRYDCRGDRRIWLDFANRIINPELFRDDGASV